MYGFEICQTQFKDQNHNFYLNNLGWVTGGVEDWDVTKTPRHRDHGQVVMWVFSRIVSYTWKSGFTE